MFSTEDYVAEFRLAYPVLFCYLKGVYLVNAIKDLLRNAVSCRNFPLRAFYQWKVTTESGKGPDVRHPSFRHYHIIFPFLDSPSRPAALLTGFLASKLDQPVSVARRSSHSVNRLLL